MGCIFIEVIKIRDVEAQSHTHKKTRHTDGSYVTLCFVPIWFVCYQTQHTLAYL
jgi:hypothetical protein